MFDSADFLLKVQKNCWIANYARYIGWCLFSGWRMNIRRDEKKRTNKQTNNCWCSCQDKESDKRQRMMMFVKHWAQKIYCHLRLFDVIDNLPYEYLYFCWIIQRHLVFSCSQRVSYSVSVALLTFSSAVRDFVLHKKCIHHLKSRIIPLWDFVWRIIYF
jgi:hypothetical protein